MKSLRRMASMLLACAAVASVAAAAARGQSAQTGTIEFVARATPTGGRAEPVRQLTFFLLRRSLADIQKEVEERESKTDLDGFVDGLEVSKELKAWMKRKRSVELAGTDFIRRLKADDILEVPEFWEAYLQRNAGDTSVGFPAPKHRPKDAAQNPQKYEQQLEDYRKQVRKYIESNPQSMDGIEVHLDAINPGQRWAQRESQMRLRVRQRALKLAQTNYLAAKTDTDLEGRGVLTGIPPGEYWLGTLENEAVVGDARLRWDTPVTVRAGQLIRIELSNLNAAEPQRPAR